MLTKNQLKRIISLRQKKYRLKQQLFIAEGPKVIFEFLNSNYELVEIFSTSQHYNQFKAKFNIISEEELNKISLLTTPNKLLAIFKIPQPLKVDTSKLILALDEINNPGNLGTIIRLCDWFGVKDLVCSNNTVDCYNYKVVQSAMGSHIRVNISYVDLEYFLEKSSNVIGTFTESKNSIYETQLPSSSSVIVLGNEANGISSKIASKINMGLTIPRFGTKKNAESLNVANSAAIILSEFKRKSIER
ncbi:MAG: RNA methyltransferase [Flavobacteriaceae bacterium]|nr:RNA methyltransferase [Flavobacteriaceae bacterium]|tara:strand:+ start:14265 stop:15002 length:738 start_codon:yes stop_codon:yes gene_type:complete